MSDIADLRERLARIETKLDQLVSVEPRLRKVENRQHYWAGGGTFAGFLAGIFGAHVMPFK